MSQGINWLHREISYVVIREVKMAADITVFDELE